MQVGIAVVFLLDFFSFLFQAHSPSFSCSSEENMLKGLPYPVDSSWSFSWWRFPEGNQRKGGVPEDLFPRLQSPGLQMVGCIPHWTSVSGRPQLCLRVPVIITPSACPFQWLSTVTKPGTLHCFLLHIYKVIFSLFVLSHIQLFVTPWTVVR